MSRRGLTWAEMAQWLTEQIEDLDNMECTFWACRGSSRPENMVTCSIHWAVYDMRKMLRRVQRKASQEVAA